MAAVRPGTVRGGLRSLLNSGSTPRVNLLETSSLLGAADYFSEIVPDAAEARKVWAGRLVQDASRSELVFLDPDNGLEVPSRPFGRKHSSKYSYWPEIARIWENGASILILSALPSREACRFHSTNDRGATRKNRRHGGGISYPTRSVPARDSTETLPVDPSRHWASRQLVGATDRTSWLSGCLTTAYSRRRLVES